MAMGLKDIYSGWQKRWAALRELDELGSDGREALARDIGVPQEALPRLMATRSRPAQELPRLMRVLSLRPDEVGRKHPAVMRDMLLACAGCAEARRCRRDLDGGPARVAFKRYCPNAETLEALSHEARLESRAA
jgi:hypothetical protein